MLLRLGLAAILIFTLFALPLRASAAPAACRQHRDAAAWLLQDLAYSRDIAQQWAAYQRATGYASLATNAAWNEYQVRLYDWRIATVHALMWEC